MKIIEQIVPERFDGRMIKHFLRSGLGISYSTLTRLKQSDGMLVNGRTVHANYPLHSGDTVTLNLEESGSDKEVPAEPGEVPIVYMDGDLILIDKPAPLACQCTPHTPGGTLENRMKYFFREEPDYVFRPLNRLDKGTSGLMAVARHAHACQLLQKTLHGPDFIREYLAVVEGVLTGSGTVSLPIAKADEASVRRVINRESGQEAVTHYRSEGTDGKRSLVRLRLETGRTHQIRVHMSAIGHPVSGDFLYGTELPEIPERFALHSTYISLIQPLTGERIERTSPLPEELRKLIKL